MFALFTNFVFAQNVVGKYTAMNLTNNIEASIKQGDLRVWVAIPGDENTMFKIEGENDLNSFILQLKKCKEKYIEWCNVAKTNNVTNYAKKFDVSFPNIEIWWKGSKWFSSYKRNFFRPSFFINKEGTAIFIVNEQASDWDNEYIDTEFTFILGSVDDFDNLITALNPEKIRNALTKNENIDDLFK